MGNSITSCRTMDLDGLRHAFRDPFPTMSAIGPLGEESFFDWLPHPALNDAPVYPCRLGATQLQALNRR